MKEYKLERAPLHGVAMGIAIRPAQDSDLGPADALIVASINDLTTRHGYGPIAKPSSPRFQRFSLNDDPEGLWVAESDGRLIGFGHSWTCDRLWFLAQLFVQPDLQASGVGRELLAKTLHQAESRNASARALITFAFNRTSQGLYMRHGLYPLCQLYVMSVPRDTLASHHIRGQLRPEPLESSAPVIEQLADIDKASLGVSRSKHHQYLLTDGGLSGVSLWAGKDCVGYAYIGSDGRIGPLGVTETRFVADAFAAALAIALETGSDQVTAFVPGASPPALELAIGIGMRITMPMLLMGEGLPQPWDRYMPRNPGMM